MLNINDYKSELKDIITAVNTIFRIDTAIFDREANIVASTELYHIHKGGSVYMPYIEYVIGTGNMLITEPGEMDSCTGCRFKHNCPSAKEIFKCITIGDKSAGVLSITSFSKERYDKLLTDVDEYCQMADNLLNLIHSFLIKRTNPTEPVVSQASLLTAIELSEDAYILTDNDGGIQAINSAALELFSFCGINIRTIYQFLPDNVVSVILSGQTVLTYNVKIDKNVICVHSSPIKDSGKITGIAIRITGKDRPPASGRSGMRSMTMSLATEIKGKSAHVESIKKQIKKIADSPSTVFISGETGTGKSMLAKCIHNMSRRKNKPFVMINCTSIPESLFESELFGYEAGAFTGAKKEGKLGKFELADGGTLFLDEISEIPLSIQAKLLSVLQESSFERVGGITPVTVDVRIIAASNRDPEEMTAEKRFRSDLFYRLNVIPMELIPLRERKEDIRILSQSFLERYNQKLCKSFAGFDEEVMKLFKAYGWPGNIRQLENVIEYCVNMAEGSIIRSGDLPPDFVKSMRPSPAGSILKDTEYSLILKTVDKYGWNVKGKTMAAKELGIGLRTLYRKLGEAEKLFDK